MKQLISRSASIALALAVACAAPVFTLTPTTLAADAIAQAAAPAQTDVPVKMVVLYSSGVGYFEHQGSVTGTTAAELHFKSAQINDLLKSLILQDLDKGQITAITYPSQDPLSKLLKSFQVDVSANLSRADLLAQLRGAKVTCDLLDGKKLSGTILGVEIEQVPVGTEGNLQSIPVLNLLNDQGITNVRLTSVSYLSFEDARLRAELNKALAALAQARDQDKKAVTINFAGEGTRRVKLGYIIETPIWKTSYRLLLSDDKDAKPFIQGWAIVENQTDNDWNNIQLSLVSGRPISFVQDLYQPLYIPRPVVQPELFASLKPQEYNEGMDQKEAKEMNAPAVEMPSAAPASPMAAKAPSVVGGIGGTAGMRSSASQAEKDKGIAFGNMGRGLAMGVQTRALDAAGVASAAAATNLGELFQYTVAVPVTLPRQKSAMLPIIADPIDAQRVSIYNASTLARNPLNGAILTNTTGKHLLQGPITVIDNGAYGGDARIQDLPPKQNRLISFGIDLQTLVDSTSATNTDTIRSAKIVKGVLQVARKNVFTQEYKVENKGAKDKSLVIEHPLRQGWKLITPAKPMETTDTLYRFQIPAPAGKPTSLKVEEENTFWQSFEILPFDINQLLWYARNGEIAQTVRDALTKAATMKQALATTQQQIQQTQGKINDASKAQGRIRENLKAVQNQAQAAAYTNNLLKRMADQDAQIDTLQQQLDTLQQQADAQQKALDQYLQSLTVE